MDNQEAKQDKNKPMVHLLFRDFPRAMFHIAEVATFGKEKYPDKGMHWSDADNALERYQEAMMRHLLAEELTDGYDIESGLLHYAHFAWNAVATLEMKLAQAEEESKKVLLQEALDKEAMKDMEEVIADD